MSYQTIDAGITERFFTVVNRNSGGPIVAGTVNYYLRAKSGVNDGKWWRNSDQTWQATEQANQMTHQADGHWEIDLTSSPFTNGVRFFEYVKDSDDFHIPDSRHLYCNREAGIGSGDSVVTMTILDSGSGNPIPGARVWVTSDAGGATVVAGYITTNAQGKVPFMLNNGAVYYLWMTAEGFNAIQGTQFTAVAD